MSWKHKNRSRKPGKMKKLRKESRKNLLEKSKRDRKRFREDTYGG